MLVTTRARPERAPAGITPTGELTEPSPAACAAALPNRLDATVGPAQDGGPGTAIDAAVLRGGRGGLPPLIGYQPLAVAAVTRGLRQGGRGQLIAACGTGKTVVGIHTALQVCPNGLVVLTCPTLPLLAETLQRWAGITQHLLAVCSDPGVASRPARCTASHAR